MRGGVDAPDGGVAREDDELGVGYGGKGWDEGVGEVAEVDFLFCQLHILAAILI